MARSRTTHGMNDDAPSTPRADGPDGNTDTPIPGRSPDGSTSSGSAPSRRASGLSLHAPAVDPQSSKPETVEGRSENAETESESGDTEPDLGGPPTDPNTPPTDPDDAAGDAASSAGTQTSDGDLDAPNAAAHRAEPADTLAGHEPETAPSADSATEDTLPGSDEDPNATVTARPITEDGEATGAPVPPGPPEDDLTGHVLSHRYKLEARIGEGAMGAVYRATHTLIHKRVAIKVLHPTVAQDEEIVARFQREAQAAAHIEHRNICAATDFGKTPDGMFFLVMEYLEGDTLEDAIERDGRMAPARACRIVDQIASALVRAHELGIVHRDLKPENVFLVERDGEEDVVKIVDFGIARVYLELGDENSTKLTQAGMVYGTPHYLSPEQAAGEPVTPRSDLYAVGVMFYEMLTGRRPFEGGLGQLLAMHMTRPPPPFSETAPDAGLSAELEAIVMSLLEKMPDDRTADAGELRAQLSALDGGALTSAAAPPGSGAGIERRGAGERQPASPTQIRGTPSGGQTVGDRLRAAGSRLQPLGERARETARSLWQRGKRLDPPVLIGAGIVLMVFTLVIALIALSGDEDETSGDDAVAEAAETRDDGTAIAAEEGDPSTESNAASELGLARIKADKEVAKALELIEDGFVDAGVARLAAQKKRFEGDPDFAVVLATAYHGAGDEDAAMELVSEVADENPRVLAHEGVRQIILDTFSKERSRDARPARDILEKRLPDAYREELLAMGVRGKVGSHKQLRKRVRYILDAHGIFETLPKWQQLSLELRLNDRTGCHNRRPIVEELRELGDPKGLPVLQTFWKDYQRGGQARRNHECMADVLETTIAELKAKR